MFPCCLNALDDVDTYIHTYTNTSVDDEPIPLLDHMCILISMCFHAVWSPAVIPVAIWVVPLAILPAGSLLAQLHNR